MKRFALLIFFCILFISCSKFSKETLKKVSSSRSGIDFLNEIIETDSLNYQKFPYMYMGGGVSVGDINNDGLEDIFFTGNLVPNRLYLNKGNMRFEDISEKAGIMGNHQWFTGTTMADVNNDGWLDIYVCVSSIFPPSDNLLFINNKDNTFTECGKSYGINDKSSSIQATFFDYNNDGFLDLYVANYPVLLVSMGAQYYHDRMLMNNHEESGHLYRNNGNKTFTDVTDEAGIRNFGMSIGLIAMDLNNDGWKDLYVSNDFNPPDYFYLNNKNGTFTEVLKKSVFQTSLYGMGLDGADFNNDGLIDLCQMDMLPEEYYRRTMNVKPMTPESFNMGVEFGLHYQYMQNSLQLNNGVFDSIPIFSNIALITNTTHTDWSWAPLFADLDNDMNKDLVITNGVLRDINDRDILKDIYTDLYLNKIKEYRPELFNSTPVPNYIFKNNGDLSFKNVSADWGFNEPTFSNGIAYGDLDNDGDLDLVISNINKVSSIFENRVVSRNNHYIKINLKGPKNNPFGIGSIIKIKTGKTCQYQDLTLTRGYMSSMPPSLYFGLGKYSIIDSILITWPDGKQQTIRNVKADQLINLEYNDSQVIKNTKTNIKKLFKDITESSGIHFRHTEDNYNDFNAEPLLPYKNSQLGPGLAVGDINNDGFDDFFIGNAEHSKAAMYFQTNNSKFIEIPGPWKADSLYEDTGALLFDADSDGRKDLYVVSGGNWSRKPTELYKDRLYLNTKNGFVKAVDALPGQIIKSGKCVKSADFDNDGDPDIFVGGRIMPGKYPTPPSSYILKNNGKKGNELKFEDVTNNVAPMLKDIGMVTDAVWTDFDSDKDLDIILVGEWMNIKFLENTNGHFKDVSEEKGFGDTAGWWYSICEIDIDKDGDNDYIAGNLGLNYNYKTINAEPFEIFHNDFDLDGKSDILLAYENKGKHIPAQDYDAIIRQIPIIGYRYVSFKDFANSTLEDLVGIESLNKALHYKVNTFASYWIENNNGHFSMHELPYQAQFSSINAISEINIDKKNTSFVIAGNIYTSESITPRNDAGIGLLLNADSKGNILAVPPHESGLFVKGEVKAIGKVRLTSGNQALLFAINNDFLKLIELIP